MAHHPRPFPQFASEFALQPAIRARQQEQGNDAVFAEVVGEQVALREGDAVADAGRPGGRLGLLDPGRVDIDAVCECPALRRGEDDPAVAAAKVDQPITGTDVGKSEHPRDHFHRRRPKRRIELTVLARERPALGGHIDFIGQTHESIRNFPDLQRAIAARGF